MGVSECGWSLILMMCWLRLDTVVGGKRSIYSKICWLLQMAEDIGVVEKLRASNCRCCRRAQRMWSARPNGKTERPAKGGNVIRVEGRALDEKAFSQLRDWLHKKSYHDVDLQQHKGGPRLAVTSKLGRFTIHNVYRRNLSRNGVSGFCVQGLSGWDPKVLKWVSDQAHWYSMPV